MKNQFILILSCLLVACSTTDTTPVNYQSPSIDYVEPVPPPSEPVVPQKSYAELVQESYELATQNWDNAGCNDTYLMFSTITYSDQINFSKSELAQYRKNLLQCLDLYWDLNYYESLVKGRFNSDQLAFHNGFKLYKTIANNIINGKVNKRNAAHQINRVYSSTSSLASSEISFINGQIAEQKNDMKFMMMLNEQARQGQLNRMHQTQLMNQLDDIVNRSRTTSCTSFGNTIDCKTY